MSVLIAGSGSMHKFNYIYSLDDLKNVEKNGRKVFSCFSCGGGSSMGYKLAGYEVIGNLEIDPEMNEIYVENNHPKHNFLMDIRDFATTDLPEELFDLDILDGSPPCSTFSMCGAREAGWGKEKKFREGQKKQTLDDLFFEFIKVAERLQPKVIVAENVKGLIAGKARGYVREIIKHLDDAGYTCQIFLLNAALMGVPQKRERVFFIAQRKDMGFPKLTLKYEEEPILYGEFADEDYIPLNKGTAHYKRWQQRSSKDNALGDTVKDREYGKVSCFSQRYIKLEGVASTQTESCRHTRFDVPGLTSDKDVITIQTFPQDYNFLKSDVVYVCGMSVPPVMMAHIASDIYDQWFKSGVE